jgi:hypothetical protein
MYNDIGIRGSDDTTYQIIYSVWNLNRMVTYKDITIISKLLGIRARSGVRRMSNDAWVSSFRL